MITLKDWMEIVDYRITEGTAYTWNCFGHDAYMLDSWNGDHNGHSMSITFDTKTQVVYMVEAHDFKNNRAYRIFNSDYKAGHDAEMKVRGVIDQAWEDDAGKPIEFVDLDVDDDFIQKSLAIVAGQEYDTNVMLELDITDEEFVKYARLAHEMDITFNEFVNRALRDAIDNRTLFKDWK
ncbi:hypothetical protein UFOVP1636_286 [uncultured Caudovirales phage]|uniref:Uncharacterized protein n=1 Tax=uncultured Caudovirales phage TaxID=2100421 RepID=A0A6J5T1L4_9CAUD|nr:hypothetical protein UFOVP1636_286 [uncultured Caudovirales phage]